MSKINNLEDLKSVVLDRWSELNEINPTYLSDVGNAAKEAYRTIYWHLSFHDTLDTLSEDEEFLNLVSIPNKHPEFYKVIRVVNRAIERISE